MLKKLVSTAAPGSPSSASRRSELAELIVPRPAVPRRAPGLRLLAHGPDPRVYGLLGIAHILLGSLRASRERV
jgi:hypothetical protein